MRRIVNFLIVGAGPTGIGAAVRLEQLGEDYLVVEANPQVGGMASTSVNDFGFRWDLGGHVLHSHFDSFDCAIRDSQAELLQVKRNGWVWWDGELHPTPVQQNLVELPTDVRPGAPAANLREYYVNEFGQELADGFFDPYQFKMWAHPTELTGHEWTSLKSGSGQANVPKLGLARDRQQRDEYFPYPKGGTGALWDAIAQNLTDKSRYVFKTQVLYLDMPKRLAVLSNGDIVHYRYCVSSASIARHMAWSGDSKLWSSLGDLAVSKVYAIGVGVEGAPPEALADKTWLYSPDQDVPWYRCTVLSNYDPGNAPGGHWNALCEVSTSSHRPLDLMQAQHDTIASLTRLGVNRHAVVSIDARTIPMGYPVPTLGLDTVLRAADDLFRLHGLYSRGRFGGFRYQSCNQDYSFAQGWEAVEAALYGTPEDVLWHPEKF